MTTQLKPYADTARDAAAEAIKLTCKIRVDPESPLNAYPDPVRVLSGLVGRMAEVAGVTLTLLRVDPDGTVDPGGSSERLFRDAERRVSAAAAMLREADRMIAGDLRKLRTGKRPGARLRTAGARGSLDALVRDLNAAKSTLTDDGTRASLAVVADAETRIIRALAWTCRGVGDAAFGVYESLRGQLGSPYGRAPGRIAQAGTDLNYLAGRLRPAHTALAGNQKGA